MPFGYPYYSSIIARSLVQFGLYIYARINLNQYTELGKKRRWGQE